MDAIRFAKLFDHSIVRPDATRAEVAKAAETAARLATATLTVQPHYIPFAASLLRGSGVLGPSRTCPQKPRRALRSIFLACLIP